VVVASKDGGIDRENYSLCLVDNLMQKPTVSELVEGHAILDDGRALLDTGIIAARGKAWQDLVTLALIWPYHPCIVTDQNLQCS